MVLVMMVAMMVMMILKIECCNHNRDGDDKVLKQKMLPIVTDPNILKT